MMGGPNCLGFVGQGGTGLLQNSRHIAPTPLYLPRDQFKLTAQVITVSVCGV